MDWDVIGRIALAALLGGAIGFDRELSGKSAGLRTNILVSAAAAVFADVSVNGFEELRGYDPSRVAADVVSGVGFLGAGAIFAMGGRPRGLTTAAALWASAAAGLATGVGRWWVGLALVVLGLLTLTVLSFAEQRFLGGRRTIVRDLYLVLDEAPTMRRVQSHFRRHSIRIRKLEMVELGASIGVDLVLHGKGHHIEAALDELAQITGLQFASDERGSAETV